MTTSRLWEKLRSPAEARVTVPAAPDAVYDVLSDPDTYPDWLAGAQRVRHVDGRFPEPGARFDHEVGPTEATTVSDDTTVVAAARPHHLELEVHVGPATGVVEFDLERTADGTLVTFRERTTGLLGLAMPLLRGPFHLRNKASLQRLKQRFEPLVVPFQ